jgi:hypothetical protein
MGDKDCTLALNFGGPVGDEDNVPAKVYEQPELKQPDPSVLILEAHIHANPKPKISWLCNGDFVKETERKFSKLEPRAGEKNKWNATLTILVSLIPKQNFDETHKNHRLIIHRETVYLTLLCDKIIGLKAGN